MDYLEFVVGVAIPNGRLSALFCWSTSRMGNRDVLGLLDCRPFSYEARKKEEKERLKLGHYQRSDQDHSSAQCDGHRFGARRSA